MATEAKYTIVGRYMDGPNVNGYCLATMDGVQKRFTREQVIFLVGKGDVSNCKGQIYKNEVLLRGTTINLNDLPIVDEKTGNLKNTDTIGRVARGVTNEQALMQFRIVGRIMQGTKVVGFTIANAGGATKNLPRNQVEELAAQKKIGNATIQVYQGRNILRLLNTKMDDLPVTQLVAADQSSPSKAYIDALKAIYKENKKYFTYETQAKCTANEFQMKYDAGYFRFKLTGENVVVEWSASNDFDGGRATGTLSDTTVDEVADYARKAFQRISYLMSH